jgi:hypothetical protein
MISSCQPERDPESPDPAGVEIASGDGVGVWDGGRCVGSAGLWALVRAAVASSSPRVSPIARELHDAEQVRMGLAHDYRRTSSSRCTPM